MTYTIKVIADSIAPKCGSDRTWTRVALTAEIRARRICSIALPPLGCGLGGLNWADVRPRIEAALQALDGVQVFVYEPLGAEPVSDTMKHHREMLKMTESRHYCSVLHNSLVQRVQLRSPGRRMQQGDGNDCRDP